MNSPLDNIDDQASSAEIRSDIYATQYNLAQRISNPKLSALRAQNPFLSIVPFPNTVLNILLGAAGVAQDLNLPEGTKYISIRSSSEYFISRNGNAQLPIATQRSTGSTSFDPSQFVYVEEIKQLSIISTGANNAVCVNCFQQL